MTKKKLQQKGVICLRLPDALIEEIDALIPVMLEEREGERTSRAVVIRSLLRSALKVRRGTQ